MLAGTQGARVRPGTAGQGLG